MHLVSALTAFLPPSRSLGAKSSLRHMLKSWKIELCPAWGLPGSPALGRASRYPGAAPAASRCWRHSHSSCACSSPDLMFGTGGEEHITSARRSAARQGRCAANPKSLFSAFFAEALAACQIPRLFDIHSATLIAFQVEEIRAFPGLSFSLLPGCSGWL